jgi:hypothetical protein
MKTSDRVQQLLKLPANQAPAPAVQLVQFLCKKYGMCGEIYAAAYEAYAIVCEQTEGGWCDEESRRFLTAIRTDAKQSDKRPTTLPTIHMNGTGADSLKQEYRAARRAIGAAVDALAAATCNARDFYPQEPGAWQRARAERAEAFRLLQLVSNYAERWELHAAEQCPRG